MMVSRALKGSGIKYPYTPGNRATPTEISQPAEASDYIVLWAVRKKRFSELKDDVKDHPRCTNPPLGRMTALVCCFAKSRDSLKGWLSSV